MLFSTSRAERIRPDQLDNYKLRSSSNTDAHAHSSAKVLEHVAKKTIANNNKAPRNEIANEKRHQMIQCDRRKHKGESFQSSQLLNKNANGRKGKRGKEK